MDNPFGIMHIDIKNVNQVQEDVPKQKGFNVNKKIRIDMDWLFESINFNVLPIGINWKLQHIHDIIQWNEEYGWWIWIDCFNQLLSMFKNYYISMKLQHISVKMWKCSFNATFFFLFIFIVECISPVISWISFRIISHMTQFNGMVSTMELKKFKCMDR